MVRAEPENMTTHFNSEKIRLYFDELIKLEDVQNQLIVSPPLKHTPVITPQGGANRYIEIQLKDTLLPNTTYTINFGQSIVDNNEGNPQSFLTYVFSTGDYIDSLEVSGVVKDAFNRKADAFISIMLYELDSTYTDSTVYKRPPNYMTNTLDSAIIFKLKNLKAGQYRLFGIKDAGKNNMFDQNTDKIAFLKDTVSLPTDSTYLLTLFKEVPDFKVPVPSFAASNKISFGYYGDGDKMVIEPLTVLPDSVKTMVRKTPGKDTLDFWFTPTHLDSILFTVRNDAAMTLDTFTVKRRKLAPDSLTISPSERGTLGFTGNLFLNASTPLVNLDSTKISMVNTDSVSVALSLSLDTLRNAVEIAFEREADSKFRLNLLPGAASDFFGATNDTLDFNFNTKSLADYGNLTISLGGKVEYPLLLQLVDEKEQLKREIYATEAKAFEFPSLDPGNYLVRIIYDSNGNGKWDTGNYLQGKQPEKVVYYPQLIEMRANWEKFETFNLAE